MEEGSQRTRFFTTTTDFQCWHTQNPLVTNLLVSRILRVPWFLFFKGVIEWFIYIFYAWWDWDIYSHCKKAACFWSPYVVNKSLVDIRPSQVFFLPKRRSKLSIPVISALHPGRLTAGSPTNHPFRKNGKWSEPNLHEDMFQPLIFRGVTYQKQISEEFVGFFLFRLSIQALKQGNASGIPRQILSNRGLGISQMVVNCQGTVPSKCRNSTFRFRIFFQFA